MTPRGRGGPTSPPACCRAHRPSTGAAPPPAAHQHLLTGVYLTWEPAPPLLPQVKDIMAHLYFKAKESFAAQAPPEVRILKFLLTVDSRRDRATLLDQAFEPGEPPRPRRGGMCRGR